jgi:hypothetical protein
MRPDASEMNVRVLLYLLVVLIEYRSSCVTLRLNLNNVNVHSHTSTCTLVVPSTIDIGLSLYHDGHLSAHDVHAHWCFHHM